MLGNWVHLWVLDAGVVLGENCFHLNTNLEGGMALLTVPEVNTLEDGLCNLSFDVVERQVTMNQFVFCMIHIVVSLHCSNEQIYDGNWTFILHNICFFLGVSCAHINVCMDGVINKSVWL